MLEKINDKARGSCEIEEIRVGQTKECMDAVGDSNLLVIDITGVFGRYIKYYLKRCCPPADQPRVNAFQVMLSAQAALSSIRLPPPLTVRNKRDELYNDILSMIKSMELQWKPDEVQGGTASRTLQALGDVLWYIDGSHAMLAERSCEVPELLWKFTGYNQPESHKHRKRQATSLSRDVLLAHSQSLLGTLLFPFWSQPMWMELKSVVETLARSLASYSEHLLVKRSKMLAIHSSEEVVRNIGDNLTVRFTGVRACPPPFLSPVCKAIGETGSNIPLELGPLLPVDQRRRYDWMLEINQGLQVPLVHVTYAPGSSVGNLNWIWHSLATDIDSALQTSQPLIEKLKKDIPQYHTRVMRRAMCDKFGLVMSSTKKSVLRHLYKDLTSDCSASANLAESEVDERVTALFELEEPSLVYDLRDHFSGRQSKFDTFWQKAKEYLEEDVGTAVDDRRHSTVLHVAKAISVRDLRERVVERCPDGTPIPSDEWIRLQFAPVCVSSCTALRYTGRLQVRHRVQQRQWRKQHEDSHYAACIYRYEREYAVFMRDHAVFLSIDDKHRVKIGEPDFPVASAERGRQVIVPCGSQLLAGDHDFTKFSVVPSVVLLTEIPEEFSGSWYSGQVFVMLKEGAFEPSSPARHSTELATIIEQRAANRHVLFIYSDGGPDHRVTYLSVKVALIALFVKLNLDYLCAARTAPYHSYRNPVERIMSILNLGLQAVALARQKMPDEMETEAARCNSLKTLRKVAERRPEFRSACLDSVAPAKVLLTDIVRRLELKEKKFEVFTAATQEELDTFWTSLLAVDAEFQLRYIDSISAKDVRPCLAEFLAHCCRQRHYFFDILKCGKSDCRMCLPPNLPTTEFAKLRHLPDPVPGTDGHYKPFAEVFKTMTTEEHRPSTKSKTHRKVFAILPQCSAREEHRNDVNVR